MKCFVPGCENRSRNKGRIFFGLPRDPVIKNAWYENVGYPNDCTRKASPICCDEHFNLPEDMENYMRYRFMGGNKILKKGILPRFNLPNVKRKKLTEGQSIIKMELDLPEASILNKMDGTVFLKSESNLQPLETVLPQSNILTKMEENLHIKTDSDLPGSDSILPEGIINQMDGSIVIKSKPDLAANVLNQVEKYVVIKTEPFLSESEFLLSKTTENEVNDSFFIKVEPDTGEHVSEEIFQVPSSTQSLNYSYNSNEKSNKNLEKNPKGLQFPYILDQDKTNEVNPSELHVEKDLLHGVNHDFKHMFTSSSGDKEVWYRDICIQTNLKRHIRSKGIMCKPKTRDVATFMNRPEANKSKILRNEDEDFEESNSEIEEVRIENIMNRIFETKTKFFIENAPLLFLGVPKNSMYVIENMQKSLNIPIQHIYCVLKKIRLNLSHEVLSYDFGLSYSQVCRIFKKTVPLIAQYLKKHIFWPQENVISENLPVQFRNRLKKVQSLLNIFQIKIERSISTLGQGIRLYSYESKKTAKFLISSTPNGFINFVSRRYNKWNSDVSIVKSSGFLNILPENITVLSLAGKGDFKYMNNVLRRKNCKLIRISRTSTRKYWKEETKFSRWLASVRIHIKRTMNHLRDFKILENSINLSKRSEWLLDDIIIIAAALTNIQLSARNEEDTV